MKLISWNVNGLRSIFTKGLQDLVDAEKPDILCLQETKMQCAQFEDLPLIPGYVPYSCSAEKKGYSGVATYLRGGLPAKAISWRKGIDCPDFDREGRFLISDHGTFTLYNIYIPSGTTGEERQNFKYRFLDAFYLHLESLPPAERAKLIICGDYNICHRPIDIHHPNVAEKRKLSGFLPAEREWMDRFSELGLHDSFRLLHGDLPQQYSWWTFRAGAREKNLGWRIDYFFVGSDIAANVKGAGILAEVKGSDHCPVTLTLDS